MISEAVRDMTTMQHIGRDSEERLLMHAIDQLLYELEECTLIGLRQPPPDVRVRCLSVLSRTASRRELSGARRDDCSSLMERLFTAQHGLMRRSRPAEFA